MYEVWGPGVILGTGSIGFLSFWDGIYSTSSVATDVFPPFAPEKKTPPPFFEKKEKKQLGAVDCQSDRPQLVGGSI